VKVIIDTDCHPDFDATQFVFESEYIKKAKHWNKKNIVDLKLLIGKKIVGIKNEYKDGDMGRLVIEIE